jgi:alpha-D-ribose 1-methylphosphonate 5-triphosphate diphosphatase PhnM
MSASPARILGLTDRIRVAPGRRADLIIVGLDLREGLSGLLCEVLFDALKP